MVKRFKLFSAFFSFSLLLLLSGCFGTPSSVQSLVEAAPIALPAAVPGNVVMAVNDEAPIIRNQSGEPIRQGSTEVKELLRFEGFNEE